MDSLDLPLFKRLDELLKEIEESKPDLAEPSIFFADRQEAEWAFDLMRWVLETLGARNTEDRRFAITLPQDKKRLRLIFCNHPILDFSTHDPSGSKVGLLLLADQATKAGIDNSAVEWTPKQTDELSKIHFYQLPIDLVKSAEFIDQFYKPSLEHTAKKFVNWMNGTNFRKFNVPKIAQAIFSSEKRRELFDKVIDQIQTEEYMISLDCPFTPTTFDLLAELSANPKKTTYLARKDEFKRELEEPFQKLFRQIAAQLPDSIKERMETERKLFARIPKNDFKHGGAWDFYWGAFYAKGGKRIEDAQLFLWMNHERLEFGFYIGQYGSQQRQRFLKNCQDNREALYSLLDESLSDSKIWYGSRANPTHLTWEEWLKDPGQLDIHVAIALPKQEILETSTNELITQILETYKLFFPLVLLALDDNPMPALIEYLESDEPIIDVPPINPSYSLDQCAYDTHFSIEQLDTWLKAIDRKKQAVLYGPPGTGKTFVAQKLAKHLISEGDGFTDIVQFHPAYTYEDFIQGIRPKRVEGGLDYPIVPGRFLEFCKQARQCRDRCILIIDEINRANLSQVFGELMYLMEYRDAKIHLASGEAFSIPSNVRILGTMNTADRSIALVDHALRRRFAFLYLPPNYEGLRKFHASTGFAVEKLISQLKQINAQIGDHHYEIGTSFFLCSDLETQLQSIWQLEIEPYLEEFFFDQPDKVKSFQWEAVKSHLVP